MPALSDLLAFALVSLAMVLTPGPNMIYVISRSICQGPLAGLISLGGWRWASCSTCCARHWASPPC